MDSLAFSDEQFDAKEWVNSAFKSPEAATNKDKFAESLVMKLQLFIQEVNKSLEDDSQHVLQDLPRVVREADAVRQEAALLQEQMRLVKEDIAKIEQNTAESMKTLLKIDTIKSRMNSASKALQEADNWTTLSANVEDVFLSGDINAITTKLVGMQQSLQILVDVPDYKERVHHLETLKNRLEAMLSPQLVIAFNTQSVDTAQMYVRIFSDIERLPQLQKYYHRCHKAEMLRQWRTTVEADQDETLLEWMTNYYDILLSTWHNQVKWCSLVFLDASPVMIFSEILSDVLKSLDPSIGYCIEAGLKQQSNPLQFLMNLKQISERFSKSLEVAIQSYGTGLLSSDTTITLAKVIYDPYILYVQKYSSYEEMLLLDQLDTMKIESEDVLDSVRMLGESVSKVFAILNEANNRCLEFTNSCYYSGLAKAYKSLFTAYIARVQIIVNQLVEVQTREKQHVVLSDDWSFFQHTLSIIQICGDIHLQLQHLDQHVVTCLQNSAKKGEYLLSFNKRQGASPFQASDMTLLDETDQTNLKQQLLSLQQDNDPMLLKEIQQMIKQMCEHVIKSTFTQIFSQITIHLAPIPKLKVWADSSSSGYDLKSALPAFSLSPLEYITQIGQYLMTLPQHIEPFVMQDNPALKTALKQAKLPYTTKIDELNSDHLADYLLGCIATGTMKIYVDMILKINRLKPQAVKQLITDIDYLCNVLDDLDLKAIDSLQALLALLKASKEDYGIIAEGKDPRLVSAIRNMRALRIV